MEYKLQVKDQTLTVELTQNPDHTFTATLGTPPSQVRYAQVSGQRVSDHQIHLVVNGEQFQAWIGQEADGKTIVLGGERFFIQDTDNLAQTQSRKTALGIGPAQVTPPMPAMVIFVPVKLGDIVEKGDVLVVLSAMKMETSLTAPHGGVITRMGVTQGDRVMPGDILMDIDQTQPPETSLE